MKFILWVVGYFGGSIGVGVLCEKFFGKEYYLLPTIAFAVFYLAICHIFKLHGLGDDVDEPTHWYDDVHVMD